MVYHYTQLQDTIVALATPPGIGAIGVIRLSGPDAIKLVAGVFKGKNLEKQPTHTVHFGSLRDEKGQILDEVLVTLFVAPQSYTKENVVEISCHGSPYILQQAIQLFLRRGARMAQPGEFTLRSFLNGRMDLAQAEAVADLIASTSEASHHLAMQQMRGGFSDELKDLRQELMNFASLLELELDFSEEDVEFADRTQLINLVNRINTILRRLMDSFQLGNVLKTGVSTVIAGRPNAGKSTLLNALLNEERAIVSHIAGTTRDTIEEVINIHGIAFRLIDTAGLREAQDQIEAVGVQKTYEKIQQSALLLYVFDMDALTPAEVTSDVAALSGRDIPMLLVANKTDSTQKQASFYQGLTHHPVLFVSAKEKQNIDALREALYQTVLSGKQLGEGTIVANARHYDALRLAEESLAAAADGLTSGITSDFVAMDIRRALTYLGEIVGTVSTDELLGNIFGKFCIGK